VCLDVCCSHSVTAVTACGCWNLPGWWLGTYMVFDQLCDLISCHIQTPDLMVQLISAYLSCCRFADMESVDPDNVFYYVGGGKVLVLYVWPKGTCWATHMAHVVLSFSAAPSVLWNSHVQLRLMLCIPPSEHLCAGPALTIPCLLSHAVPPPRTVSSAPSSTAVACWLMTPTRGTSHLGS
jgi:hypothetical protein